MLSENFTDRLAEVVPGATDLAVGVLVVTLMQIVPTVGKVVDVTLGPDELVILRSPVVSHLVTGLRASVPAFEPRSIIAHWPLLRHFHLVDQHVETEIKVGPLSERVGVEILVGDPEVLDERWILDPLLDLFQ